MAFMTRSPCLRLLGEFFALPLRFGLPDLPEAFDGPEDGLEVAFVPSEPSSLIEGLSNGQEAHTASHSPPGFHQGDDRPRVNHRRRYVAGSNDTTEHQVAWWHMAVGHICGQRELAEPVISRMCCIAPRPWTWV
jgi:hypothetical protein